MGMLAQHPQDTPLLVRQTVLSQTGPGVRHHRLTCLEQQPRQIAMSEGLRFHGLEFI